MEERKLNEKESLELITRMIQNTRRNLDSGSGNHFIIWGFAVLITTIIVSTVVTFTNNYTFNWLWCLVPVIGISWNAIATKNQPKKIMTHIDKVQTTLWRVILYVNIAFPIFSLIYLNHNGIKLLEGFPIPFLLIPFMSLLTVGIGTVITGALISFRPLIYSGCITILLGFFWCILPNIPHFDSYIFIVWALCGMIIPGVKLNIHAKKCIKC